MTRGLHLDEDLEAVASAVLEAYTPEGVAIWWRAWVNADADRRKRMETGVRHEWSGVKAERVES